MQEELGELAHAFLKGSQGIRGYNENQKLEAEIRDALGDLFIYMLSFVNTMGWTMSEIVKEVWGEVKARNWTDNPVTGVDDEDS